MSLEIGHIEKGMLIYCQTECEMLATKRVYEDEGILTRRADKEDGQYNLIVYDFKRIRR